MINKTILMSITSDKDAFEDFWKNYKDFNGTFLEYLELPNIRFDEKEAVIMHEMTNKQLDKLAFRLKEDYPVPMYVYTENRDINRNFYLINGTLHYRYYNEYGLMLSAILHELRIKNKKYTNEYILTLFQDILK